MKKNKKETLYADIDALCDLIIKINDDNYSLDKKKVVHTANVLNDKQTEEFSEVYKDDIKHNESLKKSFFIILNKILSKYHYSSKRSEE